MRRGRKRGLVFLLCAALVFSCCPASFAAESAESSGAGPNSGEGTGNYEYVIPMEHEFVFWNEAAQRFLTRDDNKLTLYDRYGRAQTDGCLRLSELHEKIRDVDGIGRVGKNFSER